MQFQSFLELIPKIKKSPLPGHASQFKMSPPFRERLIERYKEQMKSAKKAGVMALFYPDLKGQTKLVLILRKTYRGVHSAQIGFPGGKLEPGDQNDLQRAAVRETYEEIGVRSDQFEVLKEMTEVYIPPSNFYVKPYIGLASKSLIFSKQDDEVEAIVEVLYSDFLDDRNVKSEIVDASYGLQLTVPAFTLNNYVVWGATAMMLSEIKDLLKRARQ